MTSSVSTDEDENKSQNAGEGYKNASSSEDSENNNENVKNEDNNNQRNGNVGTDQQIGGFENRDIHDELAQKYVSDIREAIEKDLESYNNHGSNKKQTFERIKILTSLKEHSKNSKFCKSLISCDFLSVAKDLLEPFSGSTYNLNVVDLTLEILDNCSFEELFMKDIFQKVRYLVKNMEDSTFRRKAQNLQHKWHEQYQISRRDDS